MGGTGKPSRSELWKIAYAKGGATEDEEISSFIDNMVRINN